MPLNVSIASLHDRVKIMKNIIFQNIFIRANAMTSGTSLIDDTCLFCFSAFAGLTDWIYFILCTAENLKIDEQECGLDFFDPTDRRYRYRMREERKKTAAGQSSRTCGIAIFMSLDSHSSRPSIHRYRQPLRIRTNSQNLRNL